MSRAARPPRLPLRWYAQVARLRLANAVWALALARARGSVAILGTAATIAVAFALHLATAPRPEPGAPAQAFAVWVIQIAIMIVAALIAYAMRPKPKEPEVVKGTAPVVEDGKGIVKVYGTVWIDDSIVLGWKQIGQDKIKAKGGKKG